jgi:hypothetical protein
MEYLACSDSESGQTAGIFAFIFHNGSLLRFAKTKREYQDYGPRFSMVIGLAQLFNSIREKHVVPFIDRCSLQTKDWKALHMSQICKHAVLDRKSFRTPYLLG